MTTTAARKHRSTGLVLAALIPLLGACESATESTPTEDTEERQPTAEPTATATEASTAPSPTTAAATSTPEPVNIEAVVTGTVDGDTIDVEVAGEQIRVRLLGVDAPETVHPDLGVQCFGPEASDFVSQQLPTGSTVILQADVTDQDQFDRALRYVWLPDGRMLNLELVFYGMAYASSQGPDTKYAEQLSEAEAQAANERRGLWGTCVEWPTATPEPTATAAPATSTPRPTATSRPVPTATPVPAPPSNCHPSYPTVCIPGPPPDLDCPEIPYRNFAVTGSDPHGFDRDNDGIGCES